MKIGDIQTRAHDGVWENVVDGRNDLRWVSGGRDQAVEKGAQLAQTLGSRHTSEPSRTPGTPGVEVPPYVEGA